MAEIKHQLETLELVNMRMEEESSHPTIVPSELREELEKKEKSRSASEEAVLEGSTEICEIGTKLVKVKTFILQKKVQCSIQIIIMFNSR